MRRTLLLGLACVSFAACAKPSLLWRNAANPTASLARDKYDCDLAAREKIHATYGDNPAAQGLYHEREFRACMASRGWRAVKV